MFYLSAGRDRRGWDFTITHHAQVPTAAGVSEPGTTDSQVLLVLHEEYKGVRELLCIDRTVGRHSPPRCSKSPACLLCLKHDSGSLVPCRWLDLFQPGNRSSSSPAGLPPAAVLNNEHSYGVVFPFAQDFMVFLTINIKTPNFFYTSKHKNMSLWNRQQDIGIIDPNFYYL